MKLGIDIGSVSAKLVILNKDKIIYKKYIKNNNLLNSIKILIKSIENKKINSCGITGSGKEIISSIIGADKKVSEIIAHAKATLHYYPDVKTVIDIGGEDSKLILIKKGKINDFKMNKDCGGGTGSLIETIANRLGYKISEVSNTALKSKTDIFLPSKCGIFCQSAVISKKNMGVKNEDILMGVCRGVAKNYISMFKKEMKSPIIFQGACAKNKALIKAFEEETNSKIIVPENCEYMGAIGAALSVKNIKKTKFKGTRHIINQEYETKIRNSNKCPNSCEIISLYENNKKINSFGNRCDRCN